MRKEGFDEGKGLAEGEIKQRGGPRVEQEAFPEARGERRDSRSETSQFDIMLLRLCS